MKLPTLCLLVISFTMLYCIFIYTFYSYCLKREQQFNFLYVLVHTETWQKIHVTSKSGTSCLETFILKVETGRWICVFSRLNAFPAGAKPGYFHRVSAFFGELVLANWCSRLGREDDSCFQGLVFLYLLQTPSDCGINMENRKRPFELVSIPDDSFTTPVKRVSEVRHHDSDYTQWGVDETCRFLEKEGLSEWEDIFRGWSLSLIWVWS